MSFVQAIEVTTSDEGALRDLVAGWHAEQKGIAPGYEGTRMFADEDNPGRFVLEVDFSSREEARANNDRSETAAWADKLTGLVNGQVTYRNYSEVYSTGVR